MDFLNQMREAAPQMANMSQALGQGMGRVLGLLQELVRLNGAASGYDVAAGTTTDAFEANTLTFSVAPRAVDLTIENQDAEVQLSYDGVVFSKSFYVKAGVVYSLAVTCRALRVRSRVTGQAAKYQALVLT